MLNTCGVVERYWPFTFVCLTIAIKDFRYSSPTCAKFDLIASKLVPLDSRPNTILIKFSFAAASKIKQLFCVIRLLFIIFFLSWLLCQLHWQNRRTAEHAWTDNDYAVYKHLNYSTAVQHLFDIASLHSSLVTSSSPIQHRDKFDLRIARINLAQHNIKIIDRHNNWNILLFKEALKTKELNPILTLD